MRDMNDITKLIKKASLESTNSSDPMAIMFGNVISVEPLQINVEQRFTLGALQLILTNNVMDHDVSITMDWSTEEITHNHGYSGSTGTADLHSHSYSGTTEDNTHGHSVKGKKTITIHNALVIGDQVILVKMQGGQEYIVLDKVVAV